MRRFYLNIFFFLFPLIVLFYLFPIERRAKFEGLKNDCYNHAIWIYDRIFLNPAQIDIAFIGSSRTINAVDDGLLENLLGEACVSNLGYCRLGMNLQYIIIRDLLSVKNPKEIVLEVREEESYVSHPVFPNLAKEEDILFSYPFFNESYFNDYVEFTEYKLQLVQEKILDNRTSVVNHKETHGYTEAILFASQEELDSAKSKSERGIKSSDGIYHNLQMQFPEFYLEKIVSLCRENKIALKFLYLPSFGNGGKLPAELKLYHQYGKVLLAPNEIFATKKNWRDANHLNYLGAEALTRWLKTQL